MNPRQRIHSAMQHTPVDRVPVMCQLSVGHYLLNTHVAPVELWFTSEGFAEALVTLQRRYRFDGILINLLGTDPEWLASVRRIETSADGSQTVHYCNGDTAQCPGDDNVHHFASQKQRRPTLEEVDPDKIYYDDPHGPGGLKYPFYFGLDSYEADRQNYWPDYVFRTIDLVLAEVAGEVSVHSEVFSPWTQLMELFGYEQALMYMLDDSAKIHAILQSYTQGTIDLACRQAQRHQAQRHQAQRRQAQRRQAQCHQAQRGIDAVLISSAFAGGGFISPAQYEEFVLPYERQVVEQVKQHGVAVYTHTCGKIGDRLEQMVATGLDGIDTLDPPPLGTVDLADAKQRVGSRIFFKGNIDPVHTLLKKTREEVRQDAIERLRVGSPGSGYILSSACSVSPRVPPENLTVLVESSEEFGAPQAVGLG